MQQQMLPESAPQVASAPAPAEALATQHLDELTEGLEHELERDIAVQEFYRRPWYKVLLFWVLGVCSGGLVLLAALWSLSLRAWLLFERTTVDQAQFVYIQLRDLRSGISKVYSIPGLGGTTVRYFTFHTVRFIYSRQRRVFEGVPGVPSTFSHEMTAARRAVGAGLQPCSQPQQSRSRRELQYGENLLQVEPPNFWLIFAHDALQPFNCFQYLSVLIWCLEAYYTYSVMVFAITMASVITNAVTQYQERKRMAELAHYVCEVELVRDPGLGGLGGGAARGPNGHVLVPSSQLVPGDVVVVTAGKVPYDGVLIEGECVMDETVLTGESVPVRKAAYDPELDGNAYNPDTFNHCTLFNGTIVSAVRGGRAGRPALAVVVCTGFNTAKGRLLRTIMFPRAHDLQFIKQAFYFIAFMFVIATMFYIWDVVAMVRLGVPATTIVLKAFDMITTAVPPALAACLAIATTISVFRLKKHNVFVLDAERVTLAGLLDAICFDKTGTLTESGLELGGVVPCEGGKFLRQQSNPSALSAQVQQLFAACHGLTQLGDAVVGDPLDQRLFEASGFEMRFEDEPPAGLVPPPGLPLLPASASSASLAQQQNGAAAADGEKAAAPADGGQGDLMKAVQSAGPFLVLRRSRQQAMAPPPPVAVTAVISSPTARSGSGGAGEAGQQALLLHGARSTDVQLTPADAWKAAGAGGRQESGSDAAGPRGSEEQAGGWQRGGVGGALATLGKQLSGRGSRSLDEPHAAAAVVSAAEHQDPANVDPKHRAIHPASGHFAAREAVHVIRRFDFSSERLRSTAVLQQPDGRVVVVTKGSPEKLLTLMDPESVPGDFAQVLQSFTNQGLRVIAMASREVEGLAHPSQVLSLTQDKLEQGTRFMGLVLMVNRLKPESEPAIQHLHRACIRTAMVTGDHVRTAVTVARQCAIMNASTPALVVDVARGSLWDADWTFEVMAGEGGRLPASLLQHPHSLAANGHASTAASSSATQSGAGDDPLHDHASASGNGNGHHAAAPPALPAGDASWGSGGAGVEGGSASVAAAAGGAKGGGEVGLSAAMRASLSGEVQVAVTGRAWQKANLEPDRWPELLEVMLQRGTVFARMNPEDKRSLIQQLGFGEVDAAGRMRAGCGYYTGYCGDGANDLGALKGALVGVSLCDAEASIAAPMTSRTPHIGVMVTVVAEGRGSMTTTLIIFKYIMVYAFTQVLSLALLYNEGLTVGNYQYLIQDLFHTSVLASCMALTAPADSLSRERPLARVLSAGVILPVLAQMVVDTVFQVVSLAVLYEQSWFTPYDGSDPISIPVSEDRPENSTLFIISCWQLIINALVFNVGKPFRKGLWTNPWLLLSLVVLIGFNLYVLWAPPDPFKRVAPAVTYLPVSFRGILFGLVALNVVAAYLADWIVKKAYHAGKLWIDRRRSSTKAERRLRMGQAGLGAVAPPSAKMAAAASGADSRLLGAKGAGGAGGGVGAGGSSAPA